jgi:O6-methylguanine-DNA--protein-cysteine methyltransferase
VLRGVPPSILPMVPPLSTYRRVCVVRSFIIFLDFPKMASPIDGHSPPPLTPFQKRVYDAVARIPRGYVRSYGSMAAELGTSARAVGTVMGRVPSGSPVP